MVQCLGWLFKHPLTFWTGSSLYTMLFTFLKYCSFVGFFLQRSTALIGTYTKSVPTNDLKAPFQWLTVNSMFLQCEMFFFFLLLSQPNAQPTHCWTQTSQKNRIWSVSRHDVSERSISGEDRYDLRWLQEMQPGCSSSQVWAAVFITAHVLKVRLRVELTPGSESVSGRIVSHRVWM